MQHYNIYPSFSQHCLLCQMLSGHTHSHSLAISQSFEKNSLEYFAATPSSMPLPSRFLSINIQLLQSPTLSSIREGTTSFCNPGYLGLREHFLKCHNFLRAVLSFNCQLPSRFCKLGLWLLTNDCKHFVFKNYLALI